ncbi:MAG: hydrogenase nickel incorporation protein HypB [Lachnospiraceae bacterium]|nr:hydrogenase nickel incorporation protein HypB [Lachnospiraceae bacterium]
MGNITVKEVKARIISDNDALASKTKAELAADHVFFINLMSSPGSGKTTTLVRTIEALRDKYRIGVMEADVDSVADAEIIADTGVKVIQLHTGGSCHMDADMTKRGLDLLDISDLDLVFLENVGNLVCPAEFDVGATKKVMILSVPEGDDKPLKYPLMFETSDLLLINKIDALPVFDFSFDRLRENLSKVNPSLPFIKISSLKGNGFDQWTDWIKTSISESKADL